MTPIIVISNQKGGVAKTTTADALSEGMRARGLKVLAVDTDPQGSLGRMQERYVMRGSCAASSFIEGADIQTTEDGQCTVPGDEGLITIQNQFDLKGDELDEKSLMRAIDKAIALKGFDVVIVDTQPGMNFMNISAFVAATHMVIPTTADKLGAEAISQTAEFLGQIADTFPVRWEDDPAVLITQFRGISKLANTFANQMMDALPQAGFKVFQRRIPINVAIQEAQAQNKSIYETSSILRGAAYEYNLVCNLVMEWCGLEGMKGIGEQ